MGIPKVRRTKVEKTDFKRVSISLPDEVFQKGKNRAQRLFRNFSDYVAVLIQKDNQDAL